MVADVQDWLDNPATNYGWLLLGNENTAVTSKRFDSREHPTGANQPVLTVTYTEDAANTAPDITDIADQTMDENQTLTVNINATDPDGDNLTLTANNLPAFATLADNGDGTGTITFTPGDTDAGTFAGIEVIATDDGTPIMTDTIAFTLTVNDVAPVNNAPDITDIADQTMDENQTLTVNINATDPDGDNLTLTANNLPAFATLADNGDGTGTITFTPGDTDAGTFAGIEVIATDDGTPIMTDTTSFTLTVNDDTPVNNPPDIADIGDQTMNENDSLTIALSATDPDGDALTLEPGTLPSFATFGDNGDGTGELTFTPLEGDSGSYIISVIASDGQADDTTTFTLTVNDVAPVNNAPDITDIADQTMDENQTLTVNINATDPDGDNLTLTANNLPAFATLADNGDGTGTITFTPGDTDAGTFAGIEVIATEDGTPIMTDTTSFTLTVNDDTPVNNPPDIADVGDQTMNENDSLTIALSATDPDGDALTLEPGELPSFAAFTDNGDGSGELTFTPVDGDSGSYIISVIASDGQADDTTSFVLTVVDVQPGNNSPNIDDIADQSVTEDDTLVIAVNATDPDGDNLTLTTGNLPAFGSFTDNGDGTGTITFIPGDLDAGTYSGIEIIATDDGTPIMTDTTTFTLTVNDDTPVNTPPVITDIVDQTMNENDSLTIAVSATDADGDSLTLDPSILPSFAAFTDNGDGSGELTFAPVDGDSGSYFITITASDGQADDTTSFDLTVIGTAQPVNNAPDIAAITDQSMTVGDSLNVAVTATDPDGDNLTLSVENLPAFGSFTDNGDGTGTITFSADSGDAGNFSGITVIATDDGTPALSDSSVFSLTVNDSVSSGDPNIEVNPLTLNFGDVDVDGYSSLNVTVTNTGGSILHLERPSIGGDDHNEFRLTSGHAGYLAPNESTELVVDFRPLSSGAKLAKLVIRSNDPDEMKVFVPLTGTGVGDVVADDPDISIDPASYVFEDVTVGTEASFMMTVSNVGTSTLSIEEPRISGPGEKHFKIVSGTARDLATNDAEVFEIAFAPQSSGRQVAKVTIKSNDPDEPQVDVVVSGTAIASEVELVQNWPNPFNPSTTIKYSLNKEVWVSLKIYNTLGQQVKELVNAHQAAGEKSVVWDGTDQSGHKVSSGIYIYQLRAGKFRKDYKMLMTK